jgi:putative aminopeptidase FrvX
VNDDQFNFFQEIVEVIGPSGYEQDAQRIWRQRVQDAADSVTTDAMGSVIATLNPQGGPRVMLDAHVDQIGFIVRYIDENGFIWWAPLGGFDPSTLAGNRVKLMGKKGPVYGVMGRKPIHLLDAEDRKKSPELKNMWIDIGASNREEAESVLGIGDAGGRYAPMQRLQGNLVTCAAFDDRVGSYVMAETFRNLAQTRPAAAVYASSSVQEEVGLRGATAAAYEINADIGVALEVTWTTDHPESSKTQLGDIEVGKGPAIFRGVNTNPRVYERLIAAAEAEGAPYQVDIYHRGSPTDGQPMQTSRGGMATGIVSVPTRYLHTASEVLSTDDVDAAVRILTRFVQDLDEKIDLTP